MSSPMSEGLSTRERLDSWKAIADYLHRDVATVRRWEKAMGLPVHRVAGIGRSVFAYTSEIDAWLRECQQPPLVAGPAPAPVDTPTRPQPWLTAALVSAVFALVGRTGGAHRTIEPGGLHVEATGAGVVARDAAGVEQWRYPFPANLQD